MNVTRERRLAEGVCVFCGKENDRKPDVQYCWACTAKNKAKRRIKHKLHHSSQPCLIPNVKRVTDEWKNVDCKTCLAMRKKGIDSEQGI